MSRSISIHPATFAISLALAGLCFLSMSQVTVGTPLRVEYSPHPRDMVQIRQGTAFSVPVGKVFVLTALGTDVIDNSSASASTVTLSVDGVAECTTQTIYGNWPLGNPSVGAAVEGFVVPSGSSIDVASDTATTTARAWGYLCNATQGGTSGPHPLRVAYRPHPLDMIRVSEGTPFTVPAGKILVMTGLGGSAGGTGYPSTPAHVLRVDGTNELMVIAGSNLAPSPVAGIPSGLTIAPGSVVEPVQVAGGTSSPGRAWGYLVAQ